MEKQMRDVLLTVWLDWRNNYLTFATYAEHNGLTEYEAEQLIKLAALVDTHPHPEA